MINKSQEHDLKRDRITAQEKEVLEIYDSWADLEGSRFQGGTDAFSLTAMQTNTSADYVRRLLKKRVALQLRAKVKAKAMGSK